MNFLFSKIFRRKTLQQIFFSLSSLERVLIVMHASKSLDGLWGKNVNSVMVEIGRYKSRLNCVKHRTFNVRKLKK
jgi:hypothetical protein